MRILIIVLLIAVMGCTRDSCKSLECQNGGNAAYDVYSETCGCNCSQTCHKGSNCEVKLNNRYDEEKIYTGVIDSVQGQTNIPYSITITSENTSSSCIAIVTDDQSNQYELTLYNYGNPCANSFSINETDYTINGLTGTIESCESFPGINCNSDLCIYFSFTELNTGEVHQFTFFGNL